MKMQHLKFVVRWTDHEGLNHHKEYPNEDAARKARHWLLDRGAKGVDVAVSLNGKELPSNGGPIPDGADPGIDQPSFLL
jgi:hypothetical protein